MWRQGQGPRVKIQWYSLVLESMAQESEGPRPKSQLCLVAPGKVHNTSMPLFHYL